MNDRTRRTVSVLVTVGLFLGAGFSFVSAIAAADLQPIACRRNASLAGTFGCKQPELWLVVCAFLTLAGVVRILMSIRRASRRKQSGTAVDPHQR